jgi:hypothetical protein
MYKISEDQVKALASYLATRPYAEVFQGIEMLQKLEKISSENTQVVEEVKTDE